MESPFLVSSLGQFRFQQVVYRECCHSMSSFEGTLCQHSLCFLVSSHCMCVQHRFQETPRLNCLRWNKCFWLRSHAQRHLIRSSLYAKDPLRGYVLRDCKLFSTQMHTNVDARQLALNRAFSRNPSRLPRTLSLQIITGANYQFKISTRL